MPIHFAAVQERNSWRKHSRHEDLESAIRGRDGAENLLRGLGRVGRDMSEKYGAVQAVVVWEDTMQMAYAFRLFPGSVHDIQRAHVPVEIVEAFKKSDGPSDAQIEEWFQASNGREWRNGYFCAVALLLREEGKVSGLIRSVFRQSGSTDLIDESDVALFREHGLVE